MAGAKLGKIGVTSEKKKSDNEADRSRGVHDRIHRSNSITPKK
jgi:hypothetical protein